MTNLDNLSRVRSSETGMQRFPPVDSREGATATERQADVHLRSKQLVNVGLRIAADELLRPAHPRSAQRAPYRQAQLALGASSRCRLPFEASTGEGNAPGHEARARIHHGWPGSTTRTQVDRRKRTMWRNLSS